MSAENLRKGSQQSEDETAPFLRTDNTGFSQLLAEMKSMNSKIGNIQLDMLKMEVRLIRENAQNREQLMEKINTVNKENAQNREQLMEKINTVNKENAQNREQLMEKINTVAASLNKENALLTSLNKEISTLQISYGKIFTGGVVIVAIASVIGAVIGAVSRFPSEIFHSIFGEK